MLSRPSFGGPLDAFIGSLDYGKCVLGSLTYNISTDIAVQPTLFGWTVTGPIDYEPPSSVLKIHMTEDILHDKLQVLWELEKIPNAPKLDPADEAAVHHFEDTHIIAKDGQYKVRLPKCSDVSTLGQSRQATYKCFLQNERSLEKRGKLADFNTALQEYLDLGHAEEVPPSELSLNHYYLPVHGVFKSTSTTTTIRPVFDASA